MPETKTAPRTLAGIPEIAISLGTTLVNKTGSWKYIRPFYQDKVAPCNEGCPVGIDIEAYMNLLRQGKVEEARELLLRENPMPAITGRVCHHPCEAACNRREYDEPVSIHAVERMLGDLALEGPFPPPPPRTRKEKVAVVGSGPAGVGCAYHLARMGYAVTVFEAAPKPGGVLRVGIPDYRLPSGIMDRQIARVESEGVEFRCGVTVGGDLPWSEMEAWDAVFVATGAHKSRPMGVKGEYVTGVRQGLDFLKEVKRGERPSIGNRVVTVGGGNTAMDCARTARRLGAESIILYRRTKAEMPAIEAEIEEAEHEGVEFVFLAAPCGFKTENGRLVAVECQQMKLGEPDASGRRRPVPEGGKTFTLAVDTILTAIGETTQLDLLPGAVRWNDAGVATSELGATSKALWFAGGDITDDARTVANALGSGKRAAIGIHLALRKKAGDPVEPPEIPALRFGPKGNLSMTRYRGDDPVERANPANEVVRFEDLNVNHFVKIPKNRDREHSPARIDGNFEEVNQGLARETALYEASRCFNCGVCNRCELCLIFCPDIAIARDDEGFDINMDYCKGCGVCAKECPRHAIAMTREGL